MKWLVCARGVLVTDHVVRAGNYAAGTAGTQARVDDLLVEFLPLEGPAGLGRLGHLWNPTGAVVTARHRSG